MKSILKNSSLRNDDMDIDVRYAILFCEVLSSDISVPSHFLLCTWLLYFIKSSSIVGETKCD